MLMIATLAIAMASGPTAASEPRDWELDYYRLHVRSGAQCVYANGDRVALLRTDKTETVGFVVREKHRDTIIPLKFDPSGGYRYEANGGVTMYHMIRLAVDDLRRAPARRISGRKLDAFLAEAHPPACRRKSFEVDLYDK